MLWIVWYERRDGRRSIYAIERVCVCWTSQKVKRWGYGQEGTGWKKETDSRSIDDRLVRENAREGAGSSMYVSTRFRMDRDES